MIAETFQPTFLHLDLIFSEEGIVERYFGEGRFEILTLKHT